MGDPFPVGALVTPHVHTREDEYSIVTEGEIGFRSGEREGGFGEPDWLPDVIARYGLDRQERT